MSVYSWPNADMVTDKNWFFFGGGNKSKNKIDKPLPILTKKENSNQKWKGDITTNTTEIRRIIKNYFENHYVTKEENLEEMDKFFDSYCLPRLHQYIMEHLKGPITFKEIAIVVKSLLKNKSLGPDGFTIESPQTFKEDV